MKLLITSSTTYMESLLQVWHFFLRFFANCCLTLFFILASAERTYCTKADYHIALTKDILDDDIKLRQGVKEVMEVIVGLLKDWVEVDDSPDIKKARMEKYIKGIIDHNILV